MIHRLKNNTGVAPLSQDFSEPQCLQGRTVTSTNLWMCIKVCSFLFVCACVSFECSNALRLCMLVCAVHTCIHSVCLSKVNHLIPIITHKQQQTQGSRSNIHYDPYSNLLCVVAGQKRVTLFSPACTPFLGAAELTSDSANHSLINFAQPDFERHPEYRYEALLA